MGSAAGGGVQVRRPAGRLAAWATAAACATGLACTPPPSLPPLEASLPGPGAVGVLRTAWITLRFSRPAPPASWEFLALSCEGAPLPAEVSELVAGTLVVNPVGELPADTACELRWPSQGGEASLAFSTAAPGAPAQVFYDRSDRRRIAPYPDDVWLVADPETDTGQRLAVPTPEGAGDVGQLFARLLLEANRLDGFSPIGHFVLDVSDPPDPASIPTTPAQSLDPLASVGLFDLTPGSDGYGRRVPFLLQVRSDAREGQPPSHSLLIFPSIPLEPRGRYGFVVTRRAFVDPGRPYDPSEFFRAAVGLRRDGEPEAVSNVRRTLYELLEALEHDVTPPIARDDVALALRISIRATDDLPRDLLAIRRQVFEADLPILQVVAIEPPDPNLPGSGDLAAVVRGTWEAPDWRSTQRDGRPEVNVQRDEGGLPVMTRRSPVPFTLALPRAALAGRAPVVIYQHGNPGSAEDEVPRQAGAFLAREGFAVIGFTDVLNREVSPASGTVAERVEAQALDVFSHLATKAKLPEYWLETSAEQLAFVRFVREVLGGFDVLPLERPDGIPDLAVDRPLAYYGVSDGANHGTTLLAYAPELRTAALVGGGGRLAETMIHQHGDAFLKRISAFLPTVTATEVWVGMALFQGLFDRQDAHNHARFVYRDPLVVDGSTRKASILLTEGLGDTLVPNHATESLAWQLGPLPHLGPVARKTAFLEIRNGTIQGNIDVGVTAAFTQLVPLGVPGMLPSLGCLALFREDRQRGTEGHFCAQNAPEAQARRAALFLSALSGTPMVVP